jgi:hypothetical protein
MTSTSDDPRLCADPTCAALALPGAYHCLMHQPRPCAYDPTCVALARPDSQYCIAHQALVTTGRKKRTRNGSEDRGGLRLAPPPGPEPAA